MFYNLCSTCNQPSNTCSCQKTKSDNVNYTGPNLPCTGIDTNDSMTIVVQKLSDILCGLTTTSTTTIAVSTTTTTTTGSFVFVTSTPSATPALGCSQTSFTAEIYSHCSPLIVGCSIYNNPSFTTLYNGSNFWHKLVFTNLIYRITAGGTLAEIIDCSATTTTTTTV